jgi:uncharacterized membrane-anchored protein YitT (DUF2179 family)
VERFHQRSNIYLPSRGFNVVLTALLNIVFIIGSYFVIRNHRTQFSVRNEFLSAPHLRVQVGVLVGVSMMMTIISLMTAVFWGQLSNCDPVPEEIEQYSCSQPTAYGVVSALAAMLFVVQIIFSGALIVWKSEVVDDHDGGVLYDQLPQPRRSFEGGERDRESFHANAVDL